jgi:hypothetical protein
MLAELDICVITFRKMMENEENWLQHVWNLKPNHQKLDLITRAASIPW